MPVATSLLPTRVSGSNLNPMPMTWQSGRSTVMSPTWTSLKQFGLAGSRSNAVRTRSSDSPTTAPSAAVPAALRTVPVTRPFPRKVTFVVCNSPRNESRVSTMLPSLKSGRNALTW